MLSSFLNYHIRIAHTILVLLAVTITYGQYSTNAGMRSQWEYSHSWQNNAVPNFQFNEESITINGYIESFNCLNLVKGKLTVNDTLIVYGNISFGNKSQLEIKSGGLLIIGGALDTKNKFEMLNNGELVVAGDFSSVGSAQHGTFTNNGTVYLFDDNPEVYIEQWIVPNNTPYYYTRAEFDTSKLLSLYNKLQFPEYLTYEFTCEAVVDFIYEVDECSGEVIFTNKSLGTGIEPEFTWDFGTNATTQTYNGHNPTAITFDSAGQFMVSLVEEKNTGRSFGKSINVQKFLPTITFLNNTICGKGTNTLTLEGSTFNKVYFVTDAGTEDSITTEPYNINVYLEENTKKTVSFAVANSETGCISPREQIEIVSLPIPDVQIEYVSDSSICSGEIALEVIGDYSIVNWNTDESDDLIWVDTAGKYAVTVTDINNCNATDSVVIAACSVPQNPDKEEDEIAGVEEKYTFTPNGDGVNDEWVIDSIYDYPLAKIYVYDRNNNVIFKSNGSYSNDWNATKNGVRIPFDSYYYVIDYSDYQKPSIYGVLTVMY